MDNVEKLNNFQESDGGRGLFKYFFRHVNGDGVVVDRGTVLARRPREALKKAKLLAGGSSDISGVTIESYAQVLGEGRSVNLGGRSRLGTVSGGGGSRETMRCSKCGCSVRISRRGHRVSTCLCDSSDRPR